MCIRKVISKYVTVHAYVLMERSCSGAYTSLYSDQGSHKTYRLDERYIAEYRPERRVTDRGTDYFGFHGYISKDVVIQLLVHLPSTFVALEAIFININEIGLEWDTTNVVVRSQERILLQEVG